MLPAVFISQTMKKDITINLTPFEAYDIAQYFVNTLEMLQRIEVKNGGLRYHENRIKQTFETVAAGIMKQITDENENDIIDIINMKEREYNQTKNN